MAFDWKKLIFNKSAIKRFTHFYIPLAAIIFITLQGAGWLTEDKNDIAPITEISEDRLPIVYHPYYNIYFMGLEKLHPFDSVKYKHTYDSLIAAQIITPQSIYIPKKISEEELASVHTNEYLKSLNSSATLAKITELAFLKFFPSRLSRNVVLNPMKYQAGGSVLAGDLALHYGWAINLGGGFHHASRNHGEGFCPLADITLSIEALRKNHQNIKKVMIIDLDAHQGNGHEKDFSDDPNTYIVDVYNEEIFPHDETAKRGIDIEVKLKPFTGDKLYLSSVKEALSSAFRSFQPDVIYYIAGSDILEGDPLGALSISPEALIKRDQMVFKEAKDRHIPIVMLFGGGYQKSNAAIISSSIGNLIKIYPQ